MNRHSDPAQILKTVFGYDQFKPLQSEVIENVLNKRDTLAIMPTGGGKSLCYQIPALLLPGLTVVVSPLIALMKDQVEQLQALGAPALFLNSSLASDEYQDNMRQVRSGKIKLLYVAPETLLTPRLFKLLEKLPVDCLTIDEAHCISEWGHDFRPEYRQLVEVRKRFPKAVCLALTATATPQVQNDIKTTLGFQTPNQFVASFNRPNLFIEVTPKSDPVVQTAAFLKRFPKQSGIIYCFSRRQVDELSEYLADRGYAALPYHAGLDDKTRRENQEAFIRDDTQIIVATIAFGMGINKPNVRFVIHYDLPKSIEGYYQEIGRAGRDGLPAYCLLLYSYGDVRKLSYFIDQKDEPERQNAYRHLEALTRYAEGSACRRAPLLAYFGERYLSENCGMCDNCRRSAGKQVDITIPAQKFLSCVKRTGERFAAMHVTQVLMGAENEKILSYGHQALSTYGIGKDLTQKQWLFLAQQLVQKGLLEQTNDMYHTLRLTPKAYEVLKTRASMMGILEVEEAAPPQNKKIGEIEHDPELFELLRQKRKQLADQTKVPPYVIFSDRTLAEMAAYFPMTTGSFMKISGVGEVKYARYGEIFMEEIRAYCREHHLSEKRKPRDAAASQYHSATEHAEQNLLSPEIDTHYLTSPADETEDLPPLHKPRHVIIGEAYNEGQSIQALAEQFEVQNGTITNHLTKYAQEGNPLKVGEDLLAMVSISPEQQNEVLTAFAELGSEYLKPVHEHLNGAVDYDDLKILRLYYLCNR